MLLHVFRFQVRLWKINNSRVNKIRYIKVGLLLLGFKDGAHRPVVHLIWPRGLWHAGLSRGEEVPRRGYDPKLQGQVPAQGQQERAAFVSIMITTVWPQSWLFEAVVHWAKCQHQHAKMGTMKSLHNFMTIHDIFLSGPKWKTDHPNTHTASTPKTKAGKYLGAECSDSILLPPV